MTEAERLYAVRDHQAQGDYYLRHVSAMTGEGLHAKSAIAGELAHRDMVIDAQAAENTRLRAALKRITETYDAYRRRGVNPAPAEYADLVDAIEAARTTP